MMYIYIVKLTASIFMTILSFLVIQPLFSAQKMVVKKDCCSKKQCPAEKKQPLGNCQGSGCNPFMPCVYGNFFLTVKTHGELHISASETDRLFFYNDNRVFSKSSDCWHPPKMDPSLI